jgi:hypothetical protein
VARFAFFKQQMDVQAAFMWDWERRQGTQPQEVMMSSPAVTDRGQVQFAVKPKHLFQTEFDQHRTGLNFGLCLT